jgi:hypothetical protein
MDNSAPISLTPLDPHTEDLAGLDPARFQRMDAFIWKLALWTSAGRIPIGMDPNRPVLLKAWPNFTRFVVFPHAMRIAALFAQRPISPIAAARILNVYQQFVFAFISAAYALGLTVQLQLTEPAESAPVSAPPPPPEKIGLLRKILTRLGRR